jgi:DNA-binding CsgD family transcriptional regulator
MDVAADLVGVSRSLLVQWATDERGVPARHLGVLCEVLRCSPEDLVGVSVVGRLRVPDEKSAEPGRIVAFRGSGPTARDANAAIEEAIAQKFERRRPTRPALTMEEVDVLKLLVLGESDKFIASVLGETESVVRTRVSHILEELGAQNRTHAAAIAAWRGMRPE